jgi:ATP-dependent Clp protease adaptor protein ClpS
VGPGTRWDDISALPVSVAGDYRPDLNQSAFPVAKGHCRRQRLLALPSAFSKIGWKRRFCNSSPAKFAYRTAQTALLLKNLLLSSTIGYRTAVSWAAMAKHEQEGNVLEVQKTRLKPPPLYKVILLNDDYTPMDFVVVVLQTVFAMSREKATQVMLQIHREGMGVCGTYTREVAAAKVDQVLGIARRHQHPLQCTMEET